MGSISAAFDVRRLMVEILSPVAHITLHHPPLNVIDIAHDGGAGAVAGGDRGATGCVSDRSERRGQSIFGRRGCGRAHSRQSQ